MRATKSLFGGSSGKKTPAPRLIPPPGLSHRHALARVSRAVRVLDPEGQPSMLRTELPHNKVNAEGARGLLRRNCNPVHLCFARRSAPPTKQGGRHFSKRIGTTLCGNTGNTLRARKTKQKPPSISRRSRPESTVFDALGRQRWCFFVVHKPLGLAIHPTLTFGRPTRREKSRGVTAPPQSYPARKRPGSHDEDCMGDRWARLRRREEGQQQHGLQTGA